MDVWAPEPGNGVGDPVHVARTGVEQARAKGYDVVVVDTAHGHQDRMIEAVRAVRAALPESVCRSGRKSLR